MAINLAEKYSDKVAERFAKSSVTAGAYNDEIKFDGVKTVSVYSVDTAPLNDYIPHSIYRYGEPAELGDSIQTFTLSQDKCFTYSIDKGVDNDQMNVKGAAKTLKREIDEVISPYLDKYRLAAWAHNAGQFGEIATINKSTVVEYITEATAALDNALVPEDGRTLFITADNYRALKQNPDFIACDRLGEKALGKGVVGEIDGMKVVKCPEGWLPDGAELLITHKSAVIAPTKLRDYKIHSDPPGINGNLVEGRIIHDAFVLGSRANGVYVGLNSAYAVETPVITDIIANSAVSLSCNTASADIYYTEDGSDPRYSTTAKAYTGGEISYVFWSSSNMLTACAKMEDGYSSALAMFTLE